MEDKEEWNGESKKPKVGNEEMEQMLELICGNSSFLEEQILTMESSLREVIAIMNWIVSKAHKYL